MELGLAPPLMASSGVPPAGMPLNGAWDSWQSRRGEIASTASSRARSLGPSRGAGHWPEERQKHVPCMLFEAVDGMLSASKRRPDGTYDGVYVDGTFGRGGHCEEILSRLSPQGRLFAFDVDPEAVAVAHKLEARDPRFKIIHRPFGDIAEVFQQPCCLDGVMVDLGVSSPQLDDRHRAFHIGDDLAPDMRMNQSTGMPAWKWLQTVSVEELAWVIHAYGEDDDALLSERIAEHIIERQRRDGSIRSNSILSSLVKKAKGGIDDNMHPAKLTFQAIRVWMNQEMQQLDRLMDGAMDCLVPGGHLSIITFKKKEANAVRKFVREHEDPDLQLERCLPLSRLCELFPLLLTGKTYAAEQLGAQTRVSQEEMSRNWRSRSSAVMILRKHMRQSRILSPEVRPATRPPPDRFLEPRVRPAFVGGSDEVVDLRPPAPAASSFATTPTPATVASGAQEEEDDDCEEGGVVVRVQARVVQEHIADAKGYVSLRQGDPVTVYYQGSSGDEAGWSYGVVRQEPGWFPTSCVVPTPDEAG